MKVIMNTRPIIYLDPCAIVHRNRFTVVVRKKKKKHYQLTRKWKDETRVSNADDTEKCVPHSKIGNTSSHSECAKPLTFNNKHTPANIKQSETNVEQRALNQTKMY